MSSSGHHERALQLLQLASVCASAAGAAVLVHHVHTLRAELAALKEQTTTTATTTTTTSAAADAADDAADAAAGAAKPEAFAMPPPPPLRKVTFADVGGYANEVRRLLSLVQPALTSRRVFTSLGVVPPRALLLRGPPGSGKKTLAMALASRCFASFSQFSGPEVASTDGDTLMKMLFDIREREQPAIVYVQDIDALWQVDPVKQVVTSPQLILLLHFLDDLAVDDRVVVIASTTKVAPTPPLLVKYGRFDHTVLLGMPSPDDLVDIVRVACRGRSLADDALPDSDGMRALIAAHLHGGIVPADVHRLVDAAALRAINDNSKLPTALSVVTNTSASGGGGGGGGSGSQASTSSSAFSGAAAAYRRQIHLEHFREAVKHDFRPNLIRDRWIEKPNVRWEDIGGLDHIRSRIEEIIKFPLRYRSLFARFGIPRKSGVLLFGPPGVGKTMVAKAIASECQANFLSLQTSELLSSYYSQSASNLRAVFENARAAAPCVIFFDEFDSIARARGGRGGGGGGGGGGGDDDGGGGSGGGGDDSGGGGGGSSSTENEDTRLVNELLTQMDGLTSTADVFVVAATNRPTLLDPAVLRSGRLDSLLFIDLPNADGRESILETYLRKAKGVRTGAPAAASADDAVAADGAGASSGDGDDGSDGSDDTRLRSAELTALTAGCSGADLANLYRQAFHVAIRQCLNDGRDPETSLTLTSEHFRTALACVRRSVSRDDIALCKVFDERFGQVHAIVDDKAAASGGETKK